MNKEKDERIYRDQFFDEAEILHKQKILHSRILNLSLPGNDLMYGIIGKELLYSELPGKSLFWLKRAVIVDPYNTNARINLAKALFKLEREREAASFIKKELSEDSGLHLYLMNEKQRLQDLESFTKEIANVIENPEDIQLFYYYIAEALVKINKYPEALVNFQKAFENNLPMERYQHEKYSFALYHEGFFEEAIVQFEHIRKLNPNDKLAFNNIAHLNYCIGRVEKAQKEFEYILENGLKTVSTYPNFILVLLHLDQDEKVINQYKDYLQPHIVSHGDDLRRRYNEELRVTQTVLQRENIDEKTKEFNTKKLEGINKLLSFLN